MDTPAPSSMPDLTDDAARSAWLSGDSPKAPAGTTEDSAPSEPVEQAASTDASSKPASEPGTPAKPRKAQNAEERVSELLNDRAEERRLRLDAQARSEDLERRLRALEQPKPDGKTPESSPAAKQAEWKRYAEMPDAPKESDEAFATYGEYTAAMALFIADKRFEERDAIASDERRQQQDEQRFDAKVKAAAESADAYIKANPEIVKQINPAITTITPISRYSKADIAELSKPQYGDMLGDAFIAEQILVSGASVPLMAHFSTDEGAAEWMRLRSGGPEAIIRGVAVLAAQFTSGAKTQPPIRSPKTISTAPEPAETLGRRPAASPDAAEAALMSGDFSSYADEQNRRDWLRHNP